MNALLGLALGVGMIVGSALAFRHAEALAGDPARGTAADVAGSGAGGVAMHVALNRGVALATAFLGVATVLLFLS